MAWEVRDSLGGLPGGAWLTVHRTKGQPVPSALSGSETVRLQAASADVASSQPVDEDKPEAARDCLDDKIGKKLLRTLAIKVAPSSGPPLLPGGAHMLRRAL